ncbi:Uncharacterised protein [Shigella flexneri]|nr:Uncharacterised protein [Shigella flexneri]
MIGNFDPKKNKIVVRDFFNILRVCILMCLYIFRDIVPGHLIEMLK